MLWCVPFGDVTHRRWQPHTAATSQHSAAGPTTLTSDSRCSSCPYFPAVRQAGPSPSSQATIKFAGCLMPFTLTILFLSPLGRRIRLLAPSNRRPVEKNDSFLQVPPRHVLELELGFRRCGCNAHARKHGALIREQHI